MMEEKSNPRVELNDDYIDLRKRPAHPKTNRVEGSQVHRRNKTFCSSDLQSDRLRYENDPYRMIKGGLKKLATSYNASANTYKKGQNVSPPRKARTRENSMLDSRFRRYIDPDEKSLFSMSESSITDKKITADSSQPTLKRKSLDLGRTTIEPAKNKFTMTKSSDGRTKTRKSNIRSRSRDYHEKTDNHAASTSTYPLKEPTNKILNHYQALDPRLCEKYSVLKMPWKRTWTLPVFSPKSNSMCDRTGGDYFDRQTYLYDDGTEIDSTFIEGKQPNFFSKAFQNQFMALLFIGGSICGILLVSLLIWFIFGNNFFHIFFKPREAQDRSLKDYIKFIGGGIIYIVTSLFKTIGRVLTIPTQQVYQSQPEHYRWQANGQLQ